MKTNSSRNNIKNTQERINRKLKGIDVNKIARETGFQKRRAQKITPLDFLESYFLMVLSKGNKSLRAWAAKLSLMIKDTVSAPALIKKMRGEQIEFLKKVLEKAINKRVEFSVKIAECLKAFKKILLNDSTYITLNIKLHEAYPGNKNQNRKVSSIMKIHTIYDLVKGKFKDFRLSNYRDHDANHTEDIFDYAGKGDLVIRDLGYFKMDAFMKMDQKGVYFLTRYTMPIKVYDDEGIVQKLSKLFAGKDFFDKKLVITKKHRTPFRLIAIRLDKKTADERKRKVKNKKYIHSKEYMHLLEYAIFITNAEEEKLSIEHIIRIYKLRWRIEIIFKSWKSNIKLAEVSEITNPLRIESYIYCMLIYIVLFMVDFANYLMKFPNLSLMKLTKFMADNAEKILKNWHRNKPHSGFIKQLIEYFCQYDRRSDRLNFNQFLHSLG